MPFRSMAGLCPVKMAGRSELRLKGRSGWMRGNTTLLFHAGDDELHLALISSAWMTSGLALVAGRPGIIALVVTLSAKTVLGAGEPSAGSRGGIADLYPPLSACFATLIFSFDAYHIAARPST